MQGVRLLIPYGAQSAVVMVCTASASPPWCAEMEGPIEYRQSYDTEPLDRREKRIDLQDGCKYSDLSDWVDSLLIPQLARATVPLCVFVFSAEWMPY